MDKYQPIIKALKEPLRLLVLAIIPFALAYFQAIDAQWALIMVLVLRAGDKYLHELGKEKGDEILTKGIVRF